MNQGTTNESTTGLSGFLAPDGAWYPCGYKEHGHLAYDLCKKYGRNEFLDSNDQNDLALESDFIKFGLDYNGATEGGHFFYNRNIPQTENQVKWLRENTHRMTEKQQHSVNVMLYHFDKKKKQ